MRQSRNDLILRAKPDSTLTLEEMRVHIPSIFATEAHESRSSRYVYISTHDMLEQLMKRNFMPVEARLSRSKDEGRRGYTKHMIRLRPASDVGGGERRVGDTHFEVVMRNAHDGRSSYQFMAGLLRLVCLNGMVVSDADLGSVKVLHMGDRREQIQHVVEGAYTVLKQGPQVMEKIRAWQKITLTRDQQMAFAEGAHKARFDEDTPIKAAQLLDPRRSADAGNDLWSTFNRVQENVIRGGLSAIGARSRRYTTREVSGINGDIKLNKALWEMAETVAATA